MTKEIETERQSHGVAAKKTLSEILALHVPEHCRCGICLHRPENRHKIGDRTYQFWRALISLCVHEHAVGFVDCGAGSFGVKQEWLNSFDAFLDDVGECPGPDFTLKLKHGENYFDARNVRWTNMRGRKWKDRRDESLNLERIRLDLADRGEYEGLDPFTPAFLAIRYLRELADNP